MRKHGIILSVYSIIAALYIALSLILTTERNTVFWIGFAMVLFAVGLTAVITVVTNRKRSSAFPMEISMVAFSAIYAVFSCILTLTAFFARTQTIDLKISALDALKAVLLCFFEITFLRFIMAFVRATAFFGYKKKKLNWGRIERKKINVK